VKSRILVVDDDLSILELLRTLLEAEGYQVQTFDSAAAALRNALEHPPDAAIIDLMMPGMNGVDLIQALRYDQRTHQLPVLVCSAYYGNLQHITADLRHDNTSCLRKPFQIQELLDWASHTIASHKRKRRRGNKELQPEAPTPIPPASGTRPPIIPPAVTGGTSRRSAPRARKTSTPTGSSPLSALRQESPSVRAALLDDLGSHTNSRTQC
jgi:CheY-like chemotaxis protein